MPSVVKITVSPRISPPQETAIQERFKKVVEHIVAYALHPTYQGKDLSPIQQEEVLTWMLERNPTFLQPLMAFQAQEAPFIPAFFSESAKSVPPVTWWKACVSRGLPSDSVNIIVTLLKTPSASIERVFSSFGLVPSKIRNELPG